MRELLVVVAGIGIFSCNPQGEGVLAITLGTRSPVTVRLAATNADGTVGEGTVEVTTEAGSLSSGETLTLDGFGTAATRFTCNPSTEPACAGVVRVSATWTPKSGPSVDAEVRFHGTPMAGTGGGGGPDGPTILQKKCLNPTPGLEAGGCCFDDHPPKCGSYVVGDGDTITVTYNSEFGGVIDVPLRFHLPPVHTLEECKSALYGFDIDLAQFGAGTGVVKSGVGCSLGHIDSNGRWTLIGTGDCSSMIEAGPNLDCGLVWDPEKNVAGSWAQSEIGGNRKWGAFTSPVFGGCEVRDPVPPFIMELDTR